jgi:hypothetical protein
MVVLRLVVVFVVIPRSALEDKVELVELVAGAAMVPRVQRESVH